MSRTYRRGIVDLDRNDKLLPCHLSWWDIEHAWGDFGKNDYYSKWNVRADRKPWHKPNSVYKKVKKKARKAKIREALQKGNYDNIPVFRMEDERDYT